MSSEDLVAEGAAETPDPSPELNGNAPPSDGLRPPRPTAPTRGRSASLPVDPNLERRDIRTGRQSSSYVRIVHPHAREFRMRAPGRLVATERAAPPRGPAGTLAQRLKRILIGAPISTEAQEQERLTKIKALAVLSSDAISSVAYATEASMAVLITAGLAALQLNLIIAGCIAALMVIVGVSYRQTIHAYPNGGGSYIVARDNLGDIPGLVAAAALLIDYVLTVSVSVAAGVDALVSAISSLAPYTVELGVLFIALIAVVNLRGIRESGTIFAFPTYLFIMSFLIMILGGILQAVTHGGLLAAIPPHTPPSALHWTASRLGIVLILSAFAQGCSAMTGTEAISNGVPAFKRPESKNAARTLEWMVGTLFTLFLGTSYLAWRFGLEPNPNQQPTLDAQIAQRVFTGVFASGFYIVQFATLLILVLAANTSFADFPRLSSILARDNFAPHQFRLRGDRLAFSVGIIVLAALSAALLAVFRGNVDELINLYALGVFTAFTLSQAGMVRHWLKLRRQGARRWRGALAANLVGATATALVAGVITFTKFDRGAWAVVVLVPALVFLFKGIHAHYERTRVEMHELTPVTVEEILHLIVVPIAELNRPALQALAYARSITPNVIAVHVATDDANTGQLAKDWQHWVENRTPVRESAAQRVRRHWAAWSDQAIADAEAAQRRPPQLEIIESPYRTLLSPLLAYIDALRTERPEATLTVILPEYIAEHWWERLLHNQTALRLKWSLLFRPGVVVTDVPYHLRKAGQARAPKHRGG
jgi:amino acid transporter